MTYTILAKLCRAPRTLARLLHDDRGATAIEYGLLAALLAIAAIQAIAALGGTTSQTLSAVEEAMAGDAERETTPILPGNPSG